MIEFFTKIIPDSAFGQGNDFDGFEAVINRFIYLVHDFLGGDLGVVKSYFSFLLIYS